MPDLTVTLSNNNTHVDEMRLKQQLDDKVWTIRINNQTPNASIKKNENPNSLLRDREIERIKKALKSLRSASQQFPPPNTQINKLKRLNFPLEKGNASKIRYRLLLNYNFLFRRRKQASQESDFADSKAIRHQTHIHETWFTPPPDCMFSHSITSHALYGTMTNFIYFRLILIPMTMCILVEYNSTYIGVRLPSV